LGIKVSLVSAKFHGSKCWNFDSCLAKINLKKFGTELWAVCDAPNSHTNLTKDVNNNSHAATLTSSRILDRGNEKYFYRLL
jgi:hypothetical protein